MANRKHKYFLLLALLLGCFGLTKAQPSPTRDIYRLRGSVKSVQLEAAKLSNQDGTLVESRRIVLDISSYDSHGNVTQQIANDAQGVRLWKLGWAYTYDAEGREIRKEYLNSNGRVTSIGITRYEKDRSELTQYNPDGSVNHIWLAVFDDRGNLIRDVRRYPTGLAWEHLYRYDSERRLIHRVNQELNGKVIDKSTYTYDDHNNQTSWVVEDANGKLIPMFKSEYVYDAEGHVIERRWFAIDGSLELKELYKYEYDEQGNWIKRTTERQKFRGKETTNEQDVLYRQITYF